MSTTFAAASPSIRPMRHPAVRAANRQTFVFRRIFVGFGIVLASVVGVLITTTQFADATGAGTGSIVVVQPGDTFWSIARSVQPSGDVRPLVAQLAREHGGSALQPGDRISVPLR